MAKYELMSQQQGDVGLAQESKTGRKGSRLFQWMGFYTPLESGVGRRKEVDSLSGERVSARRATRKSEETSWAMQHAGEHKYRAKMGVPSSLGTSQTTSSNWPFRGFCMKERS